MGCVERAMTIAVNHKIQCHNIRNYNKGPSAGRDVIEIKWHAVLIEIDAVEMGPF
jgi:hypothetical protein